MDLRAVDFVHGTTTLSLDDPFRAVGIIARLVNLKEARRSCASACAGVIVGSFAVFAVYLKKARRTFKKEEICKAYLPEVFEMC
jgi:hypothetical protein